MAGAAEMSREEMAKKSKEIDEKIGKLTKDRNSAKTRFNQLDKEFMTIYKKIKDGSWANCEEREALQKQLNDVDTNKQKFSDKADEALRAKNERVKELKELLKKQVDDDEDFEKGKKLQAEGLKLMSKGYSGKKELGRKMIDIIPGAQGAASDDAQVDEAQRAQPAASDDACAELAPVDEAQRAQPASVDGAQVAQPASVDGAQGAQHAKRQGQGEAVDEPPAKRRQTVKASLLRAMQYCEKMDKDDNENWIALLQDLQSCQDEMEASVNNTAALSEKLEETEKALELADKEWEKVHETLVSQTEEIVKKRDEEIEKLKKEKDEKIEQLKKEKDEEIEKLKKEKDEGIHKRENFRGKALEMHQKKQQKSGELESLKKYYAWLENDRVPHLNSEKTKLLKEIEKLKKEKDEENEKLSKRIADNRILANALDREKKLKEEKEDEIEKLKKEKDEMIEKKDDEIRTLKAQWDITKD